jgi:hypothetical protein
MEQLRRVECKIRRHNRVWARKGALASGRALSRQVAERFLARCSARQLCKDSLSVATPSPCASLRAVDFLRRKLRTWRHCSASVPLSSASNGERCSAPRLHEVSGIIIDDRTACQKSYTQSSHLANLPKSGRANRRYASPQQQQHRWTYTRPADEGRDREYRGSSQFKPAHQYCLTKTNQRVYVILTSRHRT